jgi:hypothetical protein
MNASEYCSPSRSSISRGGLVWGVNCGPSDSAEPTDNPYVTIDIPGEEIFRINDNGDGTCSVYRILPGCEILTGNFRIPEDDYASEDETTGQYPPEFFQYQYNWTERTDREKILDSEIASLYDKIIGCTCHDATCDYCTGNNGAGDDNDIRYGANHNA